MVNHRKFPVCARCTGELIGIPVGLICAIFFLPPWWVCLLLMIPMVADGTIQLLTTYESTNLRRVVTGFFFGYALATLGILVAVGAYRLGFSLATK